MKLRIVLLLLLLCIFGFAQTESNTLEKASALLRAGSFSDAHRLLKTALEQTTKDPRLFTLNGFALARLREERPAIAAYESALALAPNYLPALEGAAELKFKLRTPDAYEFIQRLTTAQSAEPTAHAMLGTLAFERGDCAAAEKEFSQSEQAIAHQPQSLEARGACLLRLKHPADAVVVFDSLSSQFPDQSRFRYNLALSRLEAGLNRQAVETLLASPKVDGDADALDLLADAQERCRDTPAAIASLRKAIVLRPDDPGLYLHFADIALAHHSFQAGVDMADAGITRCPRAASLYLARGILKVQLARYPDAEKDFAQAEAIDPASRYSAALQGMSKLQQNQLETAAEDIRRRVREQPDDSFLQYLFAETLARRGAVPGTPDFRDALAAARKAVSLQPHFALARDVLGRLYLQMGDTAAAIKESRLAFATDPTDQTALYHLIRALKKAGKDEEARGLTGRLTTLKTQAQQKEIEERRYSIVVGATPASP